MSDTIDRQLVLSALNRALLNRPAPCLHHSDRGSQYASEDYRELLKPQPEVRRLDEPVHEIGASPIP